MFLECVGGILCCSYLFYQNNKEWFDVQKIRSDWNKMVKKTTGINSLEGFKISHANVIENGVELFITIPVGKKFEDLESRKEMIRDNFKCICEMENIRFSNQCKVKLITKDIGNYEYAPVKPPKIEKVYIGKTFDGEPFFMDLNKDAHLLIAGKTGTGKSFALATILTNIIYHYDKCYELYLCQTAKRDIDYLKECVPVKSSVYNPKETFALLEKAMDEINKRSEMFAKLGVKGISHYNEKSKWKLKRRIYVFEEISLYMPDDTDSEEEKENKAKVWSLLWKVVKLGREGGIHAFMLSQRSTAANLGGNGEIKSQLCRITFQQAQEIDSRNVIDCDLATTLRDQECYILSNNGLDLVKVPFVDKGFEILNKYVPEIRIAKNISEEEKVNPRVIKYEPNTATRESYTDMPIEEYEKIQKNKPKIEVTKIEEVPQEEKKTRGKKAKGVNKDVNA